MVLLGIRSTPRDEDGITSAELVYGEKLRLPGEFFSEGDSIQNPHEYVQRIREAFKNNRPVRYNSSKKTIFVHPELEKCKRVYVRVDRVREPLEMPYEGPYEVIKRTKKWYELDIKGKRDAVSVDRLKPAHEFVNQEVSGGRVEIDNDMKPILINNDKGRVKGKKKVRFASIPPRFRHRLRPINPADVPLPPSPAEVPLPPSPLEVRPGVVRRPRGGLVNLPSSTRTGRRIILPSRYR